MNESECYFPQKIRVLKYIATYECNTFLCLLRQQILHVRKKKKKFFLSLLGKPWYLKILSYKSQSSEIYLIYVKTN